MNKMMVTDWASYYIPEDRVEEFNESVELHAMMDMPRWRKEENFDKTWGDFKILPLCQQKEA
jgi:hypothetical protein